MLLVLLLLMVCACTRSRWTVRCVRPPGVVWQVGAGAHFGVRELITAFVKVNIDDEVRARWKQ